MNSCAGRLTLDENGHGISAHRYGASGAAILSSLTGADGFIDLEEDRTQIKEGDMVSFLMFNEVV